MVMLTAMGSIDSGLAVAPAHQQLGALLPYALAFLAMDGPGVRVAQAGACAAGPRTTRSIALLATVVGGGVAFYLAEHEGNPNCPTVWDGILYMATCLSVGYDNNFPTTATGHSIAAMVQTFGPALSGMAFDGARVGKASRSGSRVSRVDGARVVRSWLASTTSCACSKRVGSHLAVSRPVASGAGDLRSRGKRRLQGQSSSEGEYSKT